jgi:hypothetical protein
MFNRRSRSCPPFHKKIHIKIDLKALDDESILYKASVQDLVNKETRLFPDTKDWCKRETPLGRRRTRRVTIDSGGIFILIKECPVIWVKIDGENVLLCEGSDKLLTIE